MIKFTNLEKACKELDFELEKRIAYIAIITDYNREIMYLHMDEAWNINFYTTFNYIRPGEKVLLLKAITKDYEDYINED